MGLAVMLLLFERNANDIHASGYRDFISPELVIVSECIHAVSALVVGDRRGG